MARHESEALWAFAAEELEAEERARVAEHVAGCPECTRKLEEVRQAQALLRTVQEDVPEVRWAEVDEGLQGAAARKLARLERQPRWPWALATVGALAAVLAFVVLRPVTPDPSSSAPVAVREELPAPVLPEVLEAPAPVEEPPQAQLMATRVESVSGARIREADAPERPLAEGEQLRQGSFVRTPAKSSALLRLPEESRARLSPDSEVWLARMDPKRVYLSVKQGRLSVQASHAKREGFIVDAPGSVRVWVVGTVFSVESTPGTAVVTVLEGAVRVELPGPNQEFVGAGERLEINTARRTTKKRALSAKDRQAFQELGMSSEEAAAPSRASSGGMGSARAPERAPATGLAAAPSGTAPAEAAPARPAPASGERSEESPAPVAAAPSGSGEASGSEIAPYPVPTSPEPVEAGVLPPSSEKPGSAAQPQWVPPEPGAPMQGTADARFLWHAQEQLHATTCESFLVGLAEIAERSKVRDFREQARYLRARCFEERLSPAEAQAEYRRYLREFPKGRYIREAKAALLP
jgi:hypothetical protein